MIPSIGRIVHYVADDGTKLHLAALIVGLVDISATLGTLTVPHLRVFTPGSDAHRFQVTEDPTGQMPNSWHWPERS